MAESSTTQTTGLGAFLDQVSREYSEQRKISGVFWKGSFEDYAEKVAKNKSLAWSAWQRMYEMVMRDGAESYRSRFAKRMIPHHNFFDDPHNAGREAIFGLDEPLEILVNLFKSAALKHGPEKRVLLLEGPVGSTKSTIVRQLRRGLERFSQEPDGALYTYGWDAASFWGVHADKAKNIGNTDFVLCPMRDDPLKLIPEEKRWAFLKHLGLDNFDHLMTGLCPSCEAVYKRLMETYQGDFGKILREHVRVERTLISESARQGIGTFQPKDEKNQDSTELTGNINYRRISIFGDETDPRAFNFNGEFEVANRGMIEFVEMLKLDVAFLYDLLCASQEHLIKPKGFAQTAVDTVIIGHTNQHEYDKLLSNEAMEALKSRTIKLEVPYCTTLKDEIKVYERDYNQARCGKHFAPFTLETASLWAILTRIEEPKHHGLSLLQKLKLYDGKELPGFTVENTAQLRRDAKRDGMFGVSPRYIQDRISDVVVMLDDQGKPIECVNAFMLLRRLEDGLKDYTLAGDDQKAKFKELLAVAREEFSERVKKEVQDAIAADPEALTRLCGNYIDNVKAYTQREKVKNKFTGDDEQPDERLMRSIEEKIDIPETRKDDFRREIMNYIGALALDGKKFDYQTNERLMKALSAKLFEDQKDTIKLTALVSSNVIDKDTQAKIDIVKERLKKKIGCCEVCATNFLQYIASLFARGESKE